ncbi:mannose-6-phosphate isomerase [Geofilum rubicundum JCM 15548]|uniref:Mannose-6-phosphate isomerase n=1 Tax=Geofilum rubicundum JCM 15548 TaxID=1236989 RepID=A0A0E9M155_9BACT|nr:mannose-6-phosphate isomerase [Geofilum rubicundum JCM 15548]
MQPGDVFFIPAGRVHAIGAGILLAEIQQTSDVTYRIFDFGRKDALGKERELHTTEALDAIDFKAYSDYKTNYTSTLNAPCEVVSSPYFKTGLLDLNQPVVRDYYSLDSFIILICTEGMAKIQYGQEGVEEIRKGDTVLLPADLRQVTFVPQGTVKMLEVYLP